MRETQLSRPAIETLVWNRIIISTIYIFIQKQMLDCFWIHIAEPCELYISDVILHFSFFSAYIFIVIFPKIKCAISLCVCMRSGLLLPSGKEDKLQDVHQLSSWNFLWMQIYCIVLCSRTTTILCKYFRACDLSFMCFDLLADRRGQRLFVSWPHGSSWGRWQHWESRELWMRSTGTAWSTECQLEVGHVK